MRSNLLRWRVVAQTALIVLGIIAVKLVVAAFSLEFISLSPLFTSVLAGGVFVLGLIVAGTLADYKVADRVPAEITAALTNIHDDCAAFKHAFPDFDLERLEDTQFRIVASFLEDLADPRSTKSWRQSTTSTRRSSSWIGSACRRRTRPGSATSRAPCGGTSCASTTCSRTEFLPSANLLIQAIVAIIITVLVFVEIEPTYEAAIILGFISFFFISLLRLLSIMDRPFHSTSARTTTSACSCSPVRRTAEPLARLTASERAHDAAR